MKEKKLLEHYFRNEKQISDKAMDKIEREFKDVDKEIDKLQYQHQKEIAQERKKTIKKIFLELEKIGWKESKNFIEPMFVIPYKDYQRIKNKFKGD